MLDKVTDSCVIARSNLCWNGYWFYNKFEIMRIKRILHIQQIDILNVTCRIKNNCNSLQKNKISLFKASNNINLMAEFHRHVF